MANHLKLEAKKAFPQYLEESFGIVAEACRKADVSYHWYYENCGKDPEFKAACDEAKRIGELSGGDVVENSLYKKIMEGDTTCTIFYAKTKLRQRGYGERIEHNTRIDFGSLNLKSLTAEQITSLIKDNAESEESN